MKQESPLNQVDLSSLLNTKMLSVKELPFLGYVVLRADPTNQLLRQSITSVLGAELPLEPNTRVTAGSNDVLWYGPTEWLVITPEGQGAELVEKLRAAFGEMPASATEITGGNTMLQVTGIASRDLLVKGTPLDLHSSVFKVGSCAQTVLAKTSVTIYLLDDGDTFRMIIRRSFSDYVGEWLLDASKEFVRD